MKWEVIKGCKVYEYDLFQQAENDLIRNGYRYAGQDGHLGHIFSKVIVQQGYALNDIFARVVGTIKGNYRVEAVTRAA